MRGILHADQKAKSKPLRREPADRTGFVQKNNSCWVENLDWCWTMRIFTLWLCSIEEIDPSSSSWKSSTSSRWWSSWTMTMLLENFLTFNVQKTIHVLWSLVWRQMEETHQQEEEEQEKIPVISQTNLVSPSSSRQSGCNFIDPTLQDNVILQSNFFQFISHVGCALNLHSIINSGLIPGEVKNWTTDGHAFCLWIPWKRIRRILIRSIWLMHRVMHNACIEHGKKSERSVLGRHQSWFGERIEVLSNSIERCHSSPNTHNLFYSERY